MTWRPRGHLLRSRSYRSLVVMVLPHVVWLVVVTVCALPYVVMKYSAMYVHVLPHWACIHVHAWLYSHSLCATVCTTRCLVLVVITWIMYIMTCGITPSSHSVSEYSHCTSCPSLCTTHYTTWRSNTVYYTSMTVYMVGMLLGLTEVYHYWSHVVQL